MSHFTDIKTQIKDLAALKAACAELGLTVEENAEARGFADNRIRAEHVIRLHGPYDVALNRQPDGTYAVTADLWNGYVEQELGKDFGRLKQLYGVHKTVLEARRKGLTVRRTTAPNGSIRLALAQV